MLRFKHRRRARGIKPSVLQSAIITPAPVNNESVVHVLADNHVNRMDIIAEDDVPAAFVVNDELFHRSRLYKVAKPVVEEIKAMITDAIATSVGTSGISDRNLRWGKERMSQFLCDLHTRTGCTGTGVRSDRIEDDPIHLIHCHDTCCAYL